MAVREAAQGFRSEGPRLSGGGLSQGYGQLIQGYRDKQKGLHGLGHSRVASGLLGPVGAL